MSTIGPVVLQLKADTRSVKLAVRVLYPLVWLGILSPERAIAIGARFIRVKVTRGE